MRDSVVFTWPFPHSGVLTRLKIVCLENEKREAKKKYLDSQKMYVKDMLGRPMEKLSVSWLSPWGTPNPDPISDKKNVVFHTRFQTSPLKSIRIFRLGPLKLQQKDFLTL